MRNCGNQDSSVSMEICVLGSIRKCVHGDMCVGEYTQVCPWRYVCWGVYASVSMEICVLGSIRKCVHGDMIVGECTQVCPWRHDCWGIYAIQVIKWKLIVINYIMNKTLFPKNSATI